MFKKQISKNLANKFKQKERKEKEKNEKPTNLKAMYQPTQACSKTSLYTIIEND